MFRKKNREINIFSLSYLDVLSGVLAIFIIIVMILIPYYKTDSRVELTALKDQFRKAEQKITRLESDNQSIQKELDAARAKNEQMQQENRNSQSRMEAMQERNARLESENQQLQKENNALSEAGNKTFIIVMISWDTEEDDVDLHVVTPENNEYFFSKKSHPGYSDLLSEDDKKGPGIEVYENYEARPGIYTIYYNFYSDGGSKGPTKVKGRIFFKDGNMQLGYKTLTSAGSGSTNKELVVRIRVTNDGNVERMAD